MELQPLQNDQIKVGKRLLVTSKRKGQIIDDVMSYKYADKLDEKKGSSYLTIGFHS